MVMKWRGIAVSLLLLAGCGEGDGASSACPNDLPASCPSPAPGYAAEIAPIVKARCLLCHDAGGVASDRPLSPYAALYARRSAVLNQVHGCTMPPSGATAPTEAERAALLGWLVCGAPDN